MIQKTEKIEQLEVIKISEINSDEFGLEASKAKSVNDAFSVKEVERDGFIGVYQRLITSEITPELCDEARETRLKLVKVRTGIDKVHKTEKAYSLAYGKYCDALKNKLTLSVEQMEEGLLCIEKHFEKIEAEKKAKLKNARIELLKSFPDCDPNNYNLENMTGEEFKKLIDEQQELMEFKAMKAKKEQEERELAQKRADLIYQRQMDSYHLKMFIEDYDNILLVDLSEEDYHKMIIEAEVKEKEHNEKLAKAEEENKRLEKEKAEADAKLEAERKANAERESKIKADAEAKQKTIEEKAAKDKAEAEAKQKAAEKELADKKEAEEKAKRDAEAKLEAEKKAELEAKRKAALAPDKDKLMIWLNNISLDELQLSSAEAVNISNEITNRFDGFKKWALERIETLK